jgi:hypothetical protein
MNPCTCVLSQQWGCQQARTVCVKWPPQWAPQRLSAEPGGVRHEAPIVALSAEPDKCKIKYSDSLQTFQDINQCAMCRSAHSFRAATHHVGHGVGHHTLSPAGVL